MTAAGNSVNPPTFEERQGFLIVAFEAAIVEATG